MLLLSFLLQFGYALNVKNLHQDLPKGRDYLFCGDRIFYSSNFEDEVKISYNSGNRISSFKKHCAYRVKNIERQIKTSQSNEPLLLVGNYKRLSTKLKRVIKNKKHKAYILQHGYHYKELVKAFGKKELAQLIESNLLLPYLSKADFNQLYEGSTNNPKFLQSEYERYSSNLISQHPALLYTEDGKLFYFSYHINQDVLAKISRGLQLSASNPAAFSSSKSVNAKSKTASTKTKSQPSKQNKSKLALDNKGIEAAFPSFLSLVEDLKIAPQTIRLPQQYNINNNQALNVPDYQSIQSQIRQNKTTSLSNTKREPSKVSSRYNLPKSPLSGMGPIAISQIGVNQNNKSTYYSGGSSKSPTKKIKEGTSNAKAILKQDQNTARFTNNNEVVASANVSITLADNDYSKKDSKYTCTEKMWPHTLQYYYLKSSCLPKEKQKCLMDAKSILQKRCNAYFNNADLKSCSQNLQLLACGKENCDIELGPDDIRYQLKLTNKSPIQSIFIDEESDLPSLSETLTIIKTIADIDRDALIQYLKSNTSESKWPYINKSYFVRDILFLSLFNNYQNQIAHSCTKDTPSNIHTEATKD